MKKPYHGRRLLNADGEDREQVSLAEKGPPLSTMEAGTVKVEPAGGENRPAKLETFAYHR